MKKIAFLAIALALMLWAVSSAWASLLTEPAGGGVLDGASKFMPQEKHQLTPDGLQAQRATKTAVRSGNWSDPYTWGYFFPSVPGSGDDVIIPANITVTVNNDVYSSTNQAAAGSLTIQAGGTLGIECTAVLGIRGNTTNSGSLNWCAGTGTHPHERTIFFALGNFTNTTSGTVDCCASCTDFYFSGTQPQTFTNNGSVTNMICCFNLNNGTGLTLAGSNPIPLRRIDLFTGQVTNSSRLHMGSADVDAIVQVGNIEQDSPAGSFDTHPSYHPDALIEILYASGNTNYSTAYEIPEDGIIDFLMVAMLGDKEILYDLTMSRDIIISGTQDQDMWHDELIFIGGRLFFADHALFFNAEDFHISGGAGVYVDEFQVEVDKLTQYSIPGNVVTYLHTWETYGVQVGGVQMNFHNPTEWYNIMLVDAYVSDDGGNTWALYQDRVPVLDSVVTLDGVENLGSDTQTRIWAFANRSVPVELSSFTATISADNFVNLMWVTQSETGVLGYYVLRHTQSDLSAAITVSELIPATNSSQQHSYTFKDTEIFEDGLYYYWLQNSDFNGSVQFHGPVSVRISVADNEVPELPLLTQLKPIYPNPFNPMAFIPFSLKEDANVNFEIYNARGELMKRIPLGYKNAGNHRTQWDGRDEQGRNCGTGIYHIRMTAGKESYSRKAVLIK